jgi:hypothetical protein
MEQQYNFTIVYNGGPLQVQVADNYPFYDVSINGDFVAQLEQDHHNNWFVTTGVMDDDLPQQIGRRITLEITGQ